jgi:DNA adenine methylase
MDASQALESRVEHAQSHQPRPIELAISAGAVVPISPKPIVKWAGGKSRLLSQLIPLLPADIHARRYIEPFAGGAALFFALQPARAILADINASLIAAYKAVQRDLESVVDQLRLHEARHSTDYYYACRNAYNTGTLAEVQRAGAFLYLNRTCFNGLHRVNKRGEFNVPAGRYARPRIVNDVALRAAHHALRNVKLRAASFESILEYARPGDFVYFDPPYDAGSTASFTQYNAAAFGRAEQVALSSVVDELDRRGC